MAIACNKLTKWPENVLKILHSVFTLAATVLWLGNWHAEGTQALIIIPLICSCIVLLWYIFEDPGQYKLALLIYYSLAAVFTGIVAVFMLLRLFGYSGPAILWTIIILCLVIAAFVCYVVSAVLNGMKGRP